MIKSTKYIKKPIWAFFMLISFCGCNDKKVDSEKIRDQIEAREIKKVKIEDFLALALKNGSRVVVKYDSCISTSGQAETCNSVHPSLNIVNPSDSADLSLEEKQILSAYSYNEENKLESPDNVQEMNEAILYSHFNSVNKKTYFIRFKKDDLVKEMK
jgi:hypothetical protein